MSLTGPTAEFWASVDTLVAHDRRFSAIGALFIGALFIGAIAFNDTTLADEAERHLDQVGSISSDIFLNQQIWRVAARAWEGDPATDARVSDLSRTLVDPSGQRRLLLQWARWAAAYRAGRDVVGPWLKTTLALPPLATALKAAAAVELLGQPSLHGDDLAELRAYLDDVTSTLPLRHPLRRRYQR